MGRAKRRRSGERKKVVRWFGVQFEEVILAANPGFNAFVILRDDFLPGNVGTVVATKGKITLVNSGIASTSGSSVVMAKYMALKTNDIDTIVQNVFPFDNDQDDMGVRQLWTGSWTLPIAVAGQLQPSLEVDIDIKVKVKISSKELLALIIGTDFANSSLVSGYIRSLVALP